MHSHHKQMERREKALRKAIEAEFRTDAVTREALAALAAGKSNSAKCVRQIASAIKAERGARKALRDAREKRTPKTEGGRKKEKTKKAVS